MSEVNLVYQMYNTLSKSDKMRFMQMLGMPPQMTEIIVSSTMEEFLGKYRFHNGVCCPHCGLVDVKKNGKTKTGHQRFQCKGCGKSFTYATRTIFHGTKLPLDTYLRYVHCMMHGMTVRATAYECRISKNASFFLRHKILDALQEMKSKVKLDGIVEADETFFRISFKGNHSRSQFFSMPREPHMRGERSKKRGISLEKVCVPCAVNRDGKSIAQIANLGRASVRSISSVFGGRISPDAVLCTDKHNAYVGFAEREGINLLQLKSTQRVSGTLGIQHINGYYSQLKTFMERFHGVATKYLNNYLVWHNLRNYAEGDFNFKESVWERHNAEAIYDDSKWTYMFRPPIPLPLAA
ncbi:MAG: IS1595 family transposase [Sphaerochaetaceae bacterium]|nr:IS1595 family transposase [Sphaerochaetaceae bacterium]